MEDKIKVNMNYIVPYVFCFALSTWHCSWALAGNSQTTYVFEAKFGWTEDETILNNTLISSSGIIGLTVGSFLGGSLLKLGRRRAVLIGQLIAIVGAAICMGVNVPYLCVGRILVGIAAGVSNVTYGKFIMENMPQALAAKFSLV